MKVLVLGGDGFVGGAVADFLELKGHDVVRRSRRSGVNLFSLGMTARCLEGVRPRVIFNCAAHVGSMHYIAANAADILHDNVTMAVNLYRAVLDVCAGAHIINPISNCAYPQAASIQKETDLLAGEPHASVAPYATAKRMLYSISMAYRSQRGIRSTNLIIPNAFGPGDSSDPERTHAVSGMIARMIVAKREQHVEFIVWGSGRPVREWIFIDDVAKAMARAVEIDLREPINVAQGRGHTIRQTAEAIKSAVGYRGKLVFDDKMEDGAPCKVLDAARFRRTFPYFKFTDHEEGLRRTVAYYESAIPEAVSVL